MELVFEDEIEEREDEASRPANRGLDIYNEDGELSEPAEPTYFEEEPEEEED